MTPDSRITKDSEPNLFIGGFKIVFVTEVFFFFFFFQKPATIDIGENSQKPEYESFRIFLAPENLNCVEDLSIRKFVFTTFSRLPGNKS